jgi:glycosyltransferase involved in cell wall biosynthesis
MELSPAVALSRCRVVAIVAAYNEADVIVQVVGDLIAQGVEVYVLDHDSSDGTADAVRPLLNKGLIAIESFPHESGIAPAEAEARPWESILRRKQQLAAELDAEWFIHHDADELRDGLWPGLPLAEAIRRVDRAGFNAIDFEVLDFPPVDDGFSSGDDLRQAFPYCERSPVWNKAQIRCWKRPAGLVDLVSSGGHEAVFVGREVFPFRFLVRHYPIRSQRHGERKVVEERRPRLVAAERERGWHRQYDHISEGHCFLRDPA